MYDTHCHLNDKKYENNLSQIITNYEQNGIEKVICVGFDFESSVLAQKIAKENSSVYFSVGIHPENVADYDEQKLIALLDSDDKKMVALGEIGLDYHYTQDNKEKQKEVFVKQIKLAKKYKLPIIVHCRDAYGDCLEILKENAPYQYGGVMHCFGGSTEWAKEVIKLNFKISFAGSVTFNNAKNLQDVAKALDIRYMLVETDSPYLCPKRGIQNEPKYVQDVAIFIAKLKGFDSEQFINIVDKNALNLFQKLKN